MFVPNILLDHLVVTFMFFFAVSFPQFNNVSMKKIPIPSLAPTMQDELQCTSYLIARRVDTMKGWHLRLRILNSTCTSKAGSNFRATSWIKGAQSRYFKLF